jgi:hypothetical protein
MFFFGRRSEVKTLPRARYDSANSFEGGSRFSSHFHTPTLLSVDIICAMPGVRKSLFVPSPQAGSSALNLPAKAPYNTQAPLLPALSLPHADAPLRGHHLRNAGGEKSVHDTHPSTRPPAFYSASHRSLLP